MSLAENIKVIREGKNLTLTEFSKEVGLPKQVIWQLESGYNKNPSITTITTIAIKCQTTLDAIVGTPIKFHKVHENTKDSFVKAFLNEYTSQSDEEKIHIADVVLSLLKMSATQRERIITKLKSEFENQR